MSEFDDRMKVYEEKESYKLLPMLPACSRLDGRCFHNFTKGLGRPYDKSFSNLMIEVTKYLVDETDAKVGYTQSDEISLIWYSSNYKSQIFFDGRVQRMASILAAMTSVKFVSLLPEFLPAKVGSLPVFDCRIWNVPTLVEATNYLIWREFDATRNSISMAAHEYFSHKQLFGKSCDEMQEMLF